MIRLTDIFISLTLIILGYLRLGLGGAAQLGKLNLLSFACLELKVPGNPSQFSRSKSTPYRIPHISDTWRVYEKYLNICP